MPLKLVLVLAGMILLSAALSGHGARSQSAAPALSLMPMPAEIVPDAGTFRLTADFRVGFLSDAGPRARGAAARFLGRLAGRTGLFLSQDPFAGLGWNEGTSLFIKYGRPGRLEPNEDESYLLLVGSTRIVLDAPTDLGVLRGLETLLQLLASDEQGFAFPCLQVSDRPRFPWRGLLIDAGRHFMPVDVIKRNLDGMAAVKLNVLHWHLSEDQGFRVESQGLPEAPRAGLRRPLLHAGPDPRRHRLRRRSAASASCPSSTSRATRRAGSSATRSSPSAPGPYAIERTLGRLRSRLRPDRRARLQLPRRVLRRDGGALSRPLPAHRRRRERTASSGTRTRRSRRS